MFLIIAIIVSFVVSLLVSKKLGQLVYDKTGYNGFGGKQKFFSLLFLLVPVAIGLMQGSKPVILPLVIGALIPLGILVVLNLEAKKPAYIVGLTIVQAFYGVSFILFLVLKFTIKAALGTTISSLDINVDTSSNPIKQSALERADYVARQKGYADADDWAVKNGYDTASTAYDNGFLDKLEQSEEKADM